MKINMTHVRAAQMCSRGSRDFFARHGLDWQEFLLGGIDHELLLATGDPMALQVVELALKQQEEAQDGRR